MTPLYAQCIPYNENIKGRIGGNPPINIETEIPEINRLLFRKNSKLLV